MNFIQNLSQQLLQIEKKKQISEKDIRQYQELLNRIISDIIMNSELSTAEYNDYLAALGNKPKLKELSVIKSKTLHGSLHGYIQDLLMHNKDNSRFFSLQRSLAEHPLDNRSKPEQVRFFKKFNADLGELQTLRFNQTSCNS